jgi:pimeloyl-ACP methyl ester carboxylesterase
MTRDWQDDQPYHRSGSGDTVVLIHGFTSSWHIWKPVIEILEQDFDVIALSAPGHLGWPWPADLEVSMDNAVDLVEKRLAELGVTNAHVVGNSLGGAVALWMVSRGSAASAVGLAPALGWESGTLKVDRLFMASRKAVTEAMPQAAEILGSPELRQQILSVFMNRGDLLPVDEAVRMWEAVLAVDPIEKFLDVLETFDRPTLSADQKATILWCGDDKLLPYDRCSQGWIADAPHATFKTLDGLGHTPTYDDPQRVADEIRQAIRSA